MVLGGRDRKKPNINQYRKKKNQGGQKTVKYEDTKTSKRKIPEKEPCILLVRSH